MILIRVDANEKIGTGHLMRCLSIASSIAKRKVIVKFITADRCGEELIYQYGFENICLDTDWKNMASELPKIGMIMQRECPSLLLVDSYYATEEYFRFLPNDVPVAYIDDMNRNITGWDIDILINYNIYSSARIHSCHSGTRYLLGPKYAPLRDEFTNLTAHEIKDVHDILISAGGADPERITENLMMELCPAFPDVNFHFIVGALNPRIDEIKLLAGENVILHINEKHISGIMGKCDLAVSAAGTTLYELCAAGTPTITYTLADNQLMAAEKFSEVGIMPNVGDCRGNERFCLDIICMLTKLISDTEYRRQISHSMQQLIDGKGADRIAINLIVRLNPSEESDFEDYYEVKCGKSEIYWMGYDGIPARDAMAAIFRSRLGNNRFERSGDKRIYMIQADGNNVGMIQFTLSDEGLEFGLSVKESEQGKGYASTGMKQAVEIARKYSEHCFAHIRDDNIGSIKACMSAGLKPTNDVKNKSFPQTGIVSYRKYVL